MILMKSSKQLKAQAINIPISSQSLEEDSEDF